MKILTKLIMITSMMFLFSCAHFGGDKGCCSKDKAKECKDGSCKMKKADHSCCDKKNKKSYCQLKGKCKKDKSCCKNACKSCDGKKSCSKGSCHLKKHDKHHS